MANRLTTDFIERFDEVFSRYMAFTFYQATEATWRGDQRWRNHCHRAAKIAARALDTLLPNQSAEAVRVQLKARMEDGESYVDLGNPADPPTRANGYPMHWAVRIGATLYDPTFWQLRNVRTPLSLPHEPYFFCVDFFKISARGDDGTQVVTYQSESGKLILGYRQVTEPIPLEAQSTLLPDGLVRKHARKIVSQFAR